jgi:DNA-binding beta-propeller fold protein YncE
VATFDRDRTNGTLEQRSGLAGCTGGGGKDAAGESCQPGRGLGRAVGVAVSADAKSVYVASGDGAVAIFHRDPGTGALSQDPGTVGCISDDGSRGACRRGEALKEAAGVAVSPDGKSVYVASEGSSAVAVFDRSTATGALTQKPGRDGCIAEAGTVCQKGRALGKAAGIAVSPDGTSVYVSSLTSNGVAILHRNAATGALRQAAGPAGCIAEDGREEGCQDGSALEGPLDIEVSPDGRNVYTTAANSDALVTFDRDPATGALTQSPGTAGCISSGGSGGTCQKGRALSNPFQLAVAPDGKSVYATASDVGAGVVVLHRNPVTGALSQEPGIAGCIAEGGNGGTCEKGRALGITSGLAVSPDSRNLYVIAGGSNALAIFGQ